MLTFLCFLIPFLFFLIWTIYCIIKKEYEGEIAGILSIMSGIALLIAALVIFTGPTRTRGDIAQFKAFKETVASQRIDSISPLERLEITKKILEENEWLAGEQYWAQTLWMNWTYDKDILKLTPIK